MFDARGRQRQLSPSSSKGTLIVCVGNSLVADDAVGCRIFSALEDACLQGDVTVKQLELLGISLLDELEGEERLIVVDAVQLGAKPGTIHVMDWSEIPRNVGAPVSVHGIGIREAVEAGQLLYPEKMPRSIFLVGIEGCCFDRCDQGISEEVVPAIKGAVDEITRLIFTGDARVADFTMSEDSSHQEPI